MKHAKYLKRRSSKRRAEDRLRIRAGERSVLLTEVSRHLFVAHAVIHPSLCICVCTMPSGLCLFLFGRDASQHGATTSPDPQHRSPRLLSSPSSEVSLAATPTLPNSISVFFCCQIQLQLPARLHDHTAVGKRSQEEAGVIGQSQRAGVAFQSLLSFPKIPVLAAAALGQVDAFLN